MKNQSTGINFPRNSPDYNREYSKLRRSEIYKQQAEYRRQNKAAIKAWNKEWSLKKLAYLKATIFIALGGVCQCCGESDYRFLSIDHINGGGNEEKRQYGHGNTLLEFIIEQGIPKNKYQLLCHSCNQAKHNKAQCPHQNFNVFDSSTWN